MTDQTTPAFTPAEPADQPMTLEEIDRVGTTMTWRGTEGALVPKLFAAARQAATLRAENDQLNHQLTDYQTRGEYENGYLAGEAATAQAALDARAELATANAKLQEIAELAASDWLNLEGLGVDMSEIPEGFGHLAISADEILDVVAGGTEPVVTTVFFNAYTDALSRIRGLEAQLAERVGEAS